MIKPWDLGLGELFAAARDAVVVGEAESGTIVLWNDAAERLFGYSEDEAVGRLIEDLIPAPLQPLHRAGLDRFVKGEAGPLLQTHQVAQVSAVTKSGSEIEVELTLTPLTSESTRHYAMAVVRDVSERSRHEKQLEEANRSMTDFLAAAAHDMRNPIAIITGMATVLQDQAQDGENPSMLEAIVRQAEKLSYLVDDFLIASKLDADAVDVHPLPLEPRPSIQGVIDDLTAAEHIQIVGDPSENVLVDASHFDRILRNYLSNALAYGAPPIEVEVQRDDAAIVISVRDHGPGVSEDLLPNLFQKFVRSPQSRAQGGSGLGLSIVRGLARLNGGEAWYEPLQPAGACFRVCLPIAAGSNL